jgi:hypothetical protein
MIHYPTLSGWDQFEPVKLFCCRDHSSIFTEERLQFVDVVAQVVKLSATVGLPGHMILSRRDTGISAWSPHTSEAPCTAHT